MPKNLFLLLVFIAIPLIGFALNGFSFQPKVTEVTMPANQVVSTGKANIGGTFTLKDDEGNPVSEQSLIGDKYTLLFFGFTNCPDVCPTMLQMMADVMHKLPTETQNKINMIFVSVDPARDNAGKLKAFVDSFDPRFTGWTGTKEEVDNITKKYLAYYSTRTPQDASKPNDYQVDHSAFLYLMSPKGEYVTHFPNTIAQDELLTKLTQLTQ